MSESDGSDLRISKESAADVSKGLSDVMGELKELGGFGSATESLQGAGFSAMSMSPLEAGDGELGELFEDFCDRWDWGVRALVGDANTLAEKLGLAAGMEHEEDEYWGRTWKTGFNSLAGDPYATEDQLAKKSYGDILASNRPETPAEALQQTDAIKQDWRDTAQEVDTTGVGGAANDALRDAAGAPPPPETPPESGQQPQPGGED